MGFRSWYVRHLGGSPSLADDGEMLWLLQRINSLRKGSKHITFDRVLAGIPKLRRKEMIDRIEQLSKSNLMAIDIGGVGEIVDAGNIRVLIREYQDRVAHAEQIRRDNDIKYSNLLFTAATFIATAALVLSTIFSWQASTRQAAASEKLAELALQTAAPRLFVQVLLASDNATDPRTSNYSADLELNRKYGKGIVDSSLIIWEFPVNFQVQVTNAGARAEYVEALELAVDCGAGYNVERYDFTERDGPLIPPEENRTYYGRMIVDFPLVIPDRTPVSVRPSCTLESTVMFDGTSKRTVHDVILSNPLIPN